MAIASLLNPAQPLETNYYKELMERGGIPSPFGYSFRVGDRPKTKQSPVRLGSSGSKFQSPVAQ